MVNNIPKTKTTAVERFKTNLDKHFVSCARNNNLWEAFCEFKQKTENDEIFAKSVQSPEQRKEMNKVILDAFCKIDTSKTNFKYYNPISKLKDRYKNNRDLFSNSYLKNKKSPFMDNIMQEIIDRDISFLKETDKQQFYVLFYILGSENFKDQSDRFKALDELNKNIFPDDSKTGKFSSSKVADKFMHLNELCKKISNYQSFIISSTAVNTPGLDFNEALAKFRLDLKKSCIPAFEVANMYNHSLGLKPLDIAKFINKQEELFVANFKQKNPNIEINYSKPDLSKTYSFVKFPKKKDSLKLDGVKYVQKNSISENLKRAKSKLKDLAIETAKSLDYSSEYKKRKSNIQKNRITTINKQPKNIIKSREMSDNF